MNATKITLFLLKGEATSLRTAEIGGWVGVAVAAPRTELDELFQRKELGRAGVYILSGIDGSLDTTFYPGVGPSGPVTSVAVQTNGEILIAGQYGTINGLGWNSPALLRTDGSLDTSFDTNGAGANGSVSKAILQADGKILISGNFSAFDGTNYNDIARLNTNGALDATFNPGTGPNGNVNALGLQSSGQIILGGTFTSVNNNNLNYLARLNTGGSVDTSFNALIQDTNT